MTLTHTPGQKPEDPKMGTNGNKSKASKTKGAKEKRSRKSGRTAVLEQKQQLRQRKQEKANYRASQVKEFEKLEKKIKDLRARIQEGNDQETQDELEKTLKEALSSQKQTEANLKTIDSDLMEIDSDMNQLEKQDANAREEYDDEENWDSEEENGSEQRRDGKESNEVDVSQPHKDTEQSTSEHPAEKLVMQSVPEKGSSDEDPLFVAQEPENNKQSSNERPSSKDMDRRPAGFDDFVIDLTQDEDSANDTPTSFPLENGTVLLRARCGKLSLNSYGPRNSPMFIWSTTPASYKVERVTNLLGHPHKIAMDRDDTTDTLVYKGKIGPIKAVAWLPKHGGDSMLGLLESVEELNPSKKETNPKYIYPLSTVLVDLEGEEPQSVWIDRTKYKSLSSAGKDSSKRTDRKFYEKARDQVKKFRDWAGKRLDANWSGKPRQGRDDKSPTPLRETPDRSSAPARETQRVPENLQTPNESNNSVQSLDQRASDPESQTLERQNQADSSEVHQTSGDGTSPRKEQSQGAAPQLTYSRKQYIRDILDMVDGFPEFDEAKQMEYRALALAQYHTYKQKMDLQGATEVKDWEPDTIFPWN